MSHRGQKLPGLVPTLGLTWLYLSVVVLLPLSWLLIRAAGMPWHRIVAMVTSARALSALRLSFGCASIAAVIDALAGFAIAWTLARYRFPGRDALDAIVELPFALPTSVAGITLTFLWSDHGWLGRATAALGIKVAFAPIGIVVALTFVGLPFVVRTVQPVIQEMERTIEEAARSLGASPWQTFRRVQLPLLLPSLLTGFALALARGIGEYGSVLFISGNMPGRTEIAPLLVVTRLEQYDYQGAAVLAATMLLASLGLLVAVQFLERWASKRSAAAEVAS
jgi:sulfate transport system permease protein